MKIGNDIKSQWYQSLFSFIFKFSPVSLSVSNKRKLRIYYEMAKLYGKKLKKYPWVKEKEKFGKIFDSCTRHTYPPT